MIEGGERLVVTPEFAERGALVVVGDRVIRIEPDRLVIGGERLVVVALARAAG
jgi:hypothetical protein